MKKTGDKGPKSDRLTEEAIKVEPLRKEGIVGHGSKFGRRKEAAVAAVSNCRTLEEGCRSRHDREDHVEC